MTTAARLTSTASGAPLYKNRDVGLSRSSRKRTMRILTFALVTLLFHVSLSGQTPSGGAQISVPVRVSGSMMARQLVKHVDATFPSGALTYPSGTEVELYALIGEDGNVQEADALSGAADLARPAVEAAKSWVFRPYLLHGSPVAVQTTITISFLRTGSIALPAPPSLPPVTQSKSKVPSAAISPAYDLVSTAQVGRVMFEKKLPVAPAGSKTQPAQRSTTTAFTPILSTAVRNLPVPTFVRPGMHPSAHPAAVAVRSASFDHSPRILVQKVAPIYPAEAEALEIEGAILVEFAIKPDGTTRHITAGSGPPELRQAAIDAVSQWRYAPNSAIDQDQPTTAPVSFAIEGPSKIPPEVMAGRIEEHEVPVYPPAALASGIRGTIKMHALIGRQGQVERLDFISGPDALRESAMDAVRHWRYTPHLRNGIDVQVDTNIFVDFSLPFEAHLQ